MSRVCLDCDKDISDRGPRAKRCEGCQNLRNKESMKASHDRRKAAKQPQEPKKRGEKKVEAAPKPRIKGGVPMGSKDDPEKRPAEDAMQALTGKTAGGQISELSFAARIRNFHAACHLHYADECDPAKRKHLALTMAQLNVLEQIYKR